MGTCLWITYLEEFPISDKYPSFLKVQIIAARISEKSIANTELMW